MPVLEHIYRVHGAAAELMVTTAPEVLIEGPAGTGKTRAVLERVNAVCEQYPRARALIARATRTSSTESILVTLERDVLRLDLPGMLRNISRGQRDSYEYENGSTIVVGGQHPAASAGSSEGAGGRDAGRHEPVSSEHHQGDRDGPPGLRQLPSEHR